LQQSPFKEDWIWPLLNLILLDSMEILLWFMRKGRVFYWWWEKLKTLNDSIQLPTESATRLIPCLNWWKSPGLYAKQSVPPLRRRQSSSRWTLSLSSHWQ
jgi:hypothetical protein